MSEELRTAIRNMHGCDASWVAAATVSEEVDGRLVWTREVHTFALEGHQAARRAFAWREPVPGTTRVRYFAVLQAGPIESAQDAVRASLITDARG